MNRSTVYNNIASARSSAYRVPATNLEVRPSFKEVPFGAYEDNDINADRNVGHHQQAYNNASRHQYYHQKVVNASGGQRHQHRQPPPPRGYRGTPSHHPQSDNRSCSPGANDYFRGNEESSPLDLSSNSAHNFETAQNQQGFFVHKSKVSADGDFIWINDIPQEQFSGVYMNQTVS